MQATTLILFFTFRSTFGRELVHLYRIRPINLYFFLSFLFRSLQFFRNRDASVPRGSASRQRLTPEGRLFSNGQTELDSRGEGNQSTRRNSDWKTKPCGDRDKRWGQGRLAWKPLVDSRHTGSAGLTRRLGIMMVNPIRLAPVQ